MLGKGADESRHESTGEAMGGGCANKDWRRGSQAGRLAGGG